MGVSLAGGIAILIGAFFVYYFVLGDRMYLAQEITRAISSFGLILALFSVNLFTAQKKIKKVQEEGSGGNDVFVVSYQMKNIDGGICLFASLSILLIAWYDGSFNMVDMAQAILGLALLLGWHFYLYHSRVVPGYETVSNLNFLDKIKNGLIIYLIPVLLLLIPVLGRTFNTVDVIQTFSFLIISYFSHRYIFSKNN